MNLLFDLDGTLIDSAVGIRFSAKKTFETMALPLPALEDVPIGPPILNTIRSHLGALAEAHFETARKMYQEIYAAEGIKMFAVYEGIQNVVTELAARQHKLFIVTSKAEVFAAQMIESLGWNRFFQGVHGSGLQGELTNKGDLIEAVMNNHCLFPSETVMIGDRYHDLEAASKQSIESIGVLWGYGDREELSQYSPREILSDVSQLLLVFH